jgi:hypothetical protein
MTSYQFPWLWSLHLSVWVVLAKCSFHCSLSNFPTVPGCVHTEMLLLQGNQTPSHLWDIALLFLVLRAATLDVCETNSLLACLVQSHLPNGPAWHSLLSTKICPYSTLCPPNPFTLAYFWALFTILHNLPSVTFTDYCFLFSSTHLEYDL